MTSFAYILTTVLTLALGYGILAAASGRSAIGSNGFQRFGLMYFIGSFAVGLLMYVFDPLKVPITGRTIGGAAAGLAALLTGVAVLRGRRLIPAKVDWRALWPQNHWWECLFVVLISTKIAFVAVESFSEIRRTDDAFTWSLSLAKHIYFKGEHHSFKMLQDYPKLPGLIIAWHTLLYRPFNEFSPNLACLNWYVFYLILLYGLARAAMPKLESLAAAYFIAALPLVLSNTVLAGYSDLPLGMIVSLAGAFAYQHARGGRLSDALFALVFCLAMPPVKLEGKIPYFLIGVFVTIMSVAYSRRLLSVGKIWSVTAGLTCAAAITLAIVFSVCGQKGPSFLSAEMYKRVYPANHLVEVAPAYAAHLFYEYNNWMMAGPLAVVVILALAIPMGGGPEFSLILYCLFNLAACVYATCFGPGYEWVINGTLVNRLLLQVMPAFIYSAVVLASRLMTYQQERSLERAGKRH